MSKIIMSEWAHTVMTERYAHTKSDGTKETWEDIAHRVAHTVLHSMISRSPNRGLRDLANEVEEIIRDRKFIPAGRYLSATGHQFHQVNNCLLIRAEDTREGWGQHLYKVAMASMTGAGLGAVYSDLRAEGANLSRTGGTASGPLPLAKATNEVGRAASFGGHRRAALWGGLHWNHPDIFKWIEAKNWSEEVRGLKSKDSRFPADLDHTNISVILDDDFFRSLYSGSQVAQDVYKFTTRRMCKTGEPGFSIDIGVNTGENLRNACCELVSADDSDVCNLGSINLAKITSLEEMRKVVELATVFLLAGTVYSDVPYEKVSLVRDKNRRLGLGLLGLHEFLLSRNLPYGPNVILSKYLDEYAKSGEYARFWADTWNLSMPVKTRAVAPTGTIGQLAETTTGVEPIFCSAYKRRYFKSGVIHYQYVIDPTAKRLIDEGVDPNKIEDAAVLAYDVNRRLGFQAWLQKYVDHAISSTINLPPFGSPGNDDPEEFGNILLKHIEGLRGITVYPDGARDGQPLERVDYNDAIKHVGQVFVESMDVCDLSRGEKCGA